MRTTGSTRGGCSTPHGTEGTARCDYARCLRRRDRGISTHHGWWRRRDRERQAMFVDEASCVDCLKAAAALPTLAEPSPSSPSTATPALSPTRTTPKHSITHTILTCAVDYIWVQISKANGVQT